ncbi:type II toxin-antitoxin system HipA family toxin [Janthinobacterium lividum]|uniref:type II toxin-antitoxin system HipA family toxin n=1 Tax=Janthinobacterium lividum TaxID=29581 RepID=UPI0014098315|nr:HipA domain-containing protein [Janthinobacterium lividum]NHQ89172.1 HipA domain-containing protein [Janthinobacterium lividum]
MRLSGNGDRWGALAVGDTPKPNIAQLASPRLHRLDALVQELLAIAESRPTLNAPLRKRLFATPSMGGARPKATVQDGEDYWLVKPGLMTDTVDLALLEHATMQWSRAAGLRFADTRHHALTAERSVVRILRYDRRGARRIMTASAASLLQVQYPPVEAADSDGASYPRLAEELRRIGAPLEDGIELFGRMVFNGIVGNNGHPRNHAVLFDLDEQRWRLSPAFDVVPDTEDDPQALVMQVSAGRRDITRDAMLLDHTRFGFATRQQAEEYADTLLTRIEKAFAQVAPLLNPALRARMAERLRTMLLRLA